MEKRGASERRRVRAERGVEGRERGERGRRGRASAGRGRKEGGVVVVERRRKVAGIIAEHGRCEELRVGAVLLESEGRFQAAVQCQRANVERAEGREVGRVRRRGEGESERVEGKRDSRAGGRQVERQVHKICCLKRVGVGSAKADEEEQVPPTIVKGLGSYDLRPILIHLDSRVPFFLSFRLGSDVPVKLECRQRVVIEAERVGAGRHRGDGSGEVERLSSGGAVGGTKGEEGRMQGGSHGGAGSARRV